jgi:hypothetical protein
VKKAYIFMHKAVTRGVTFFDQMHNYFKENYDVLMPVFIEMKKPPTTVDSGIQAEIINMHDAYINEIKTSFVDALGKDRMYHRACGFVTDA